MLSKILSVVGVRIADMESWNGIRFAFTYT